MKRKNKTKKLSAILLSGLLAFGVLTAVPCTVGAVETTQETVQADNSYTEGYYTYKLLDDGTAEITGYDGSIYTKSPESLTIPSEFNGHKVTSIGKNAFEFYWGTGLSHITIPEGITSIGSSAFMGLDQLKSVNLPSTLKTIGDYAFAFCDSLTSITIPDGITVINDGTFDACESLTSMTIPDGVTEIGAFAFSDCTSLTKITWGRGLKTIGMEAFSGCTALTRVTIPDSVTYIGLSAFSECDNLKKVTIPQSVTKIDTKAFGYADEKIDGFTIYGYVGTKAQSYANEHGFTFVDLATYQPVITLGDVNDDGVIDISDATAIQKAVAQIISFTDEENTAANVNGDGTVDISDATMVQKFVAQIITEFTAA